MKNELSLPKVSVIIPTYKRSTMLPRAIDSILNQSYQNYEIIVVDDNDPNSEWRKNTEILMNKYLLNDKIKYICHNKNMNGSAARNTGIKNATGDIITFLDDDDYYLKDKLKKEVTFLLDNSQYHAVYCGWNRDGTYIPSHQGDLSFDILSGYNIILTNTIMMWKEDALNALWDESFKRHQEAAFLLRYFRNGGMIGVISEELIVYDTTDRSNAAKNGKINQEQTEHYLNTFKDMIDRCEEKNKGAKKEIYCTRYRGMMLNYILDKNIIGALKIYLKMIFWMPIKFNKDLIKYAAKYRRKNK